MYGCYGDRVLTVVPGDCGDETREDLHHQGLQEPTRQRGHGKVPGTCCLLPLCYTPEVKLQNH